MRAMIDQDIPLNAGCLVPLTSTSPPVAWLLALIPSLKTRNSHHPARYPPLAITRGSSLRRKRSHFSTNHRRLSQSLQRVCRKSRVL